MSIEKSLKRFRNRFNLTQTEVANAANIDRRAYSTYENVGDKGVAVNPSIAVLIKISQAFNVSIDYLAGISNNPEINNLPNVNGISDDTCNLKGNEFEAQMTKEIDSLKKRLTRLESRFNF